MGDRAQGAIENAEVDADNDAADRDFIPVGTVERVPTTSTEPGQTVQLGESQSKKRLLNPNKWARNIRKLKHARGESYVDSRGKLQPEKCVGKACSCRWKCFDKLGKDHISTLFRNFHELGDTKQQDLYLNGCIKSTKPKRRRPKSGEKNGARKSSFEYFVRGLDGDDKKVCQLAFHSIFGIGKTRFEKIRTCDKRGKHGNQKKMSIETREKIRAHIKSFPARSSHYSRNQNPNKVYLSEELNVHLMWLLYLKQYENDQYVKYTSGKKHDMKPVVKYKYYRNIFLTEFNIGFRSPRSDTCLKCDQLQQQIENVKGDEELVNQKSNERRLHQSQADNGYTLLRRKSNDALGKNNFDMMTFDFQQNLPLPNLTSSDMFYSRMLWVYNFGVHNCNNGDGYMNIWHEGVAARGSSEVCSCLFKIIRNNTKRSPNLVLFSDGCVGQNKNKTFITFLQYLVENNFYRKIDHYFLYRGHTFLPNDSDFGLIEKRKKLTKATLVSDYVTMIEGNRMSQPFVVKTIQTEDILDFKAVAERCMTKSTLKSNSGEKISLNDIHWFSYGQSDETNATYTSSITVDHGGEVW